MEDEVAAPKRAYAVRGTLFSFLMPWEVIHNQLYDTMIEGNLHEWPLSPEKVQQLVRVHISKSPEGIADKFRELKVRPWVVQTTAVLYIKNKVQDLMQVDIQCNSVCVGFKYRSMSHKCITTYQDNCMH